MLQRIGKLLKPLSILAVTNILILFIIINSFEEYFCKIFPYRETIPSRVRYWYFWGKMFHLGYNIPKLNAFEGILVDFGWDYIHKNVKLILRYLFATIIFRMSNVSTLR